MTYTDVKISVPREMKTYVTYYNKDMELERNALILYPYIKNLTISHGKAAEILGIHKTDLIELYEKIGLPYLDLDMEEVEEEVSNYQKLKGAGK
ncbi:MAG: UPF0175 family protein [Lachnospiraceae bacterium]|nr:UPF0175 family protein [Lachnospiraceae bacterium]MCD8397698.1 UPF0175 family protein [Lachnospiraceae bacterium]